MINRKLGNMHITNVPPAFSRNSPATNDDGTTVAVNVSRFGVNGWKCEEETTNLLPLADSLGKTSLIPNDASKTTVSLVTNFGFSDLYSMYCSQIVIGHFMGWFKQYSFGTAGLSYTGSFYVYPSKNTYIKCVLQFLNSSGSTLLSSSGDRIPITANQWNRVSANAIAPTGTAYIRFMGYNDSSLDTFNISDYMYFDNLQVEPLSYPTSWKEGGTSRSGEQLTIPANTLKSLNSAIELSLYVPTLHSIIFTILDTRDTTQTNQNNSLIINRNANGSWYLSVGYGSGYEELTSTLQPLVASTATRIGIRIDTTGIVTLWVNGVKILTSTHTLSLLLGSTISIGSTYLATQQIDGYMQPLRVSGKARSDMEMGNTGTIAIDYFTTYFLSLVSNLNPRTF